MGLRGGKHAAPLIGNADIDAIGQFGVLRQRDVDAAGDGAAEAVAALTV